MRKKKGIKKDIQEGQKPSEENPVLCDYPKDKKEWNR
jgi:hypothetical protein